jgi:transposase
MATLQKKQSRGHWYWYIVESRRINGKPRPVVLAYLGKPEDLLTRLTDGESTPIRLKSYAHGLVSALHAKAQLFKISAIIDRFAFSPREYMALKPIRNGLTIGETIVLAALGRACQPCSKQSWTIWANSSSLALILKHDVSGLDSQHFWDHMDCIPVNSIPEMETLILKEIIANYPIDPDLLLFDTTNFFTYIASTNDRCTIAKRGKNKQKRVDLRQISLALVVTKKDHLPVFHHTYQGNLNDYTTFKSVIEKIKQRIIALSMDFDRHTVVWDKGMNSAENLKLADDLKVHYVTSLKFNWLCRDLVEEAMKNAQEHEIDGEEIRAWKTVSTVAGVSRTLVIYLSKTLRDGFIGGTMEMIQKKLQELDEYKAEIEKSKKKVPFKKREAKINRIIGNELKGILEWYFDSYGTLRYWIDEKELQNLKDNAGWKVLATDRHSWEISGVIKAYNGQAAVEEEFKNDKNPMHLAFRPQFHWTDQKIHVHFFICVIAHLLSRILYKEAKEQLGFQHSMHRLLEELNSIRLGSCIAGISANGKSKNVNIKYQLEETSNDLQKRLIAAFDIKAINASK